MCVGGRRGREKAFTFSSRRKLISNIKLSALIISLPTLMASFLGLSGFLSKCIKFKETVCETECFYSILVFKRGMILTEIAYAYVFVYLLTSNVLGQILQKAFKGKGKKKSCITLH